MDDAALADCIGRVEEREDVISPSVARMLHATLSSVRDSARDVDLGMAMPPLWHWVAFHPYAPMDDIGTDGHPKLGEFLPAVPLERRMWAGGRLEFHAGLSVGERLYRRSEILQVEQKSGRAGPMVFVTVGHELHGENGLAITEEQDIVYIAMPESYRPPKAIPAPDKADFDVLVPVDVVLLFRYSAATFNAHRIHYDLPYATEVEKYPGLVVHGPLQATMLMALAVRHRGQAPSRLSHRGVHPMFHTHDLRLIGVDSDDGAMALCTAAPEGHQGFQVRAEWDQAR